MYVATDSSSSDCSMSSAEVPMKAVSKWFRLETAVIEVADVIGFDNITQVYIVHAC
jgi:hypothetical protein